MDHAALKKQLPHTWSAFFAHFGRFTTVQLQAIPPILAGQNTLISAATASGKTEAALAPLLERHYFAYLHSPHPPPATQAQKTPAPLRILYICPTRALVRDLYERLTPALERLDIPFAMKSGDTGPVSTSQPPALLITTPESTDSLLTRAPRLFTQLSALVLDEIHLFDNTVRGDHLRCLLRRIETIQRFYREQLPQAPLIPLQRVAISATVADPPGIAERYLSEPETVTANPNALIDVAGGRRLQAEIVPMTGLAALEMALALRTARKTLLFCNTRNEVEQVAAYLRKELSFDAEVFVHYSNLDPALRQEVEERFAAAAVAICVCTSTLELGIDIGSIDDVGLIGPPPTVASFLQRIGRGGRRSATSKVLCLARTDGEALHFQALIDLVERGGELVALLRRNAASYHFRPSVLVQQIFSCLKQSPTAAIRLADLRRIAPSELSEDDLRGLFDELTAGRYLTPGRPGEWRAAPLLNELIDQHEIYSNIGSEELKAQIVDAFSGRPIAQTGKVRLQGEILLMGGRVLEVVWRDRYKIGVRELPRWQAEEEFHFVVAPFAVPLEVSQVIAAHLKVAPAEFILIHTDHATWLFHFWGDLYSALLAGMLQAILQRQDETVRVIAHNAHCVRLPASLQRLPEWEPALAEQQLRLLLPRIEPFLELGRFHNLLPAGLAERTVVELCDLARFERLYRAVTIREPSLGLKERLLEMLG